MQQHGHLLYLDVGQATKGFYAQLSYSDCGIRHLNVLDYIAGAQASRITQLPATDPTPSVEISFDGWVFPKGGVAFTWVLEREITAPSR